MSSTVTVEVQVLAFPLGSVTVKVTVLLPISAQLKEEISMLELAMLQLSELPPSTSVAVMLAAPEPSSETVMDWQIATGAVESITVIVAVQLELFPLGSVAVMVIVLLPVFAHENELTSSIRLSRLQLSLEPLSTSPVVIEAAPLPSRYTVRS